MASSTSAPSPTPATETRTRPGARISDGARYTGEFAGTFLLVFVAAGAVVANAASGGVITHPGIAIATGLVVTALVYALGHLTGAHLNPAVSLAFAVGRHFPLRDLFPYWAAQLSGALLAALAVRFFWGDVANLGATLPGLSAERALVLEMLLTFLLMFVITAVATDHRAVGQAAALAIGAVVGLEVMFAGPASGASMNPARSLGPAVVSGTWTSQWIYIVGPLLGAAGGVLTYEFLRRADKPS